MISRDFQDFDIFYWGDFDGFYKCRIPGICVMAWSGYGLNMSLLTYECVHASYAITGTSVLPIMDDRCCAAVPYL